MSFGIRVKLFAGFGAVLFLFAVVAGCGLVKLGESDDSVGVLGAREMPSLQAAMNSQVAVVSVQRDLHQAVLVNDDAARAKSKASYEASDKQFAASVAELGKLLVTPEGKASLAEVTKAYADWAPTRTKALDLALKGDAKGAEEALFSDQNVKAVSTINAAIDNLVKLKQTRAQAILAEANAASDQARMLMIALSMIAGVLGFGVAFFMVRSIASAVSVVAASAQRIAREDLPSFVSVAKALAAGDLTQEVFVTATRVDVRSKDELGRMADDFNAMIDGLQETGSAFRQMTENLRALVGQVQSSANLLADTSGQLGAAANQTGAAVQQVNQAMQNVAAGAQDTSRGAQETNASVGQLTQAIDQISRGAAEQAHQVQAASATATEMAAGVEQVAANATRVAAASEQTKTAAQQGSKAVEETVAGMREIKSVVSQAAVKVQDLGKLGEKIGAVVDTIDDIAEQTNLLALNAAIEAARAGEHGKGFAVVADEVRKLAERSSRETKQIAELIRGVQDGTREAVSAMEQGSVRVDKGSAMADQAGRALSEIMVAVDGTVRQVTEIATAADAMAAAARNVTESMHSISAIVEENTASTEEMAAQSGQVADAIQAIAAVSEEQSASTEEVSASAEEMSAQVEEMSAQAQELAATADQLKALVGRFKIDATYASDKVVPLRRAA